MDRLRTIELFVHIAGTGKFSETARALNIGVPSISKHIKDLEDTLGVRLFDRTTRNLRLTEVGEVYRERCRQVLRDLEDTAATVSDFQKIPQGRLHVGAPMTFGNIHLLPLLKEFLELYPKIDVDLDLNDRFDNIIDNGFDVMIRIGEFADSSFIARKLTRCPHVICASPKYLETNGTPKSFKDLENHICLSYSNLTLLKEWRAFKDGEGFSIHTHGRFSANNGDALRNMALAGFGIALLPTFIVGRDIKDGRLVSILPDYRLRELQLHAMYPHRQYVPLKVRVFVDFLTEKFASQPCWDGA